MTDEARTKNSGERTVAMFSIRNAPGMTDEGIAQIQEWLDNVKATLDRREEMTTGLFTSKFKYNGR